MATAKQQISTTTGAVTDKSVAVVSALRQVTAPRVTVKTVGSAAKTIVGSAVRQNAKSLAGSALRQIATPRAGLYLQVSAKQPARRAEPDQQAATVLTQMSGKLSKPGLDRARVFGSNTKGVYAYSVDPKDPTQLVREDATGRFTPGKFVNGTFKATTIR